MASSTLSQTISVKLNGENYLLWQSHFTAYLRGHGLYGYIDGSTACPSRTSSSPEKSVEGTVPVTSDYTDWVKQDQLLLSAIFSSVTESVHAQIVGSSTAREAWLRLERSYASPSQARVMQLTQQLQSTKKGVSSVIQYLVKMKTLADSLAAISHPISDGALVLYVLNGLPSEYNSFVTSMTTRPVPVSFDDLQGYLISHELRLLAEQSHVDVSSPTANTVSHQQQHQQGNRSNRPSDNGSRGRGYWRGRGRGRGNNRGRGNYNHQGYQRPPPPPGFQSPTPYQYSSGYHYSPSQQVQCQICYRTGHSAVQCYNRYDDPNQATAMFAAHNAQDSDQSWFPDSGATHHVTADLGSLSTQTNYSGNDVLKVGNGSGSTHGETSTSRRE